MKRALFILLTIAVAMILDWAIASRIETAIFLNSESFSIVGMVLIYTVPKLVLWGIAGIGVGYIARKQLIPCLFLAFFAYVTYYIVKDFLGSSWNYEGALGFWMLFGSYIVGAVSMFLISAITSLTTIKYSSAKPEMKKA